MSIAEDRHARHMRTECAEVPEDVKERIMEYADYVANAQTREDFAGVIEAAYGVTGLWEEFLAGGES